MSRSTLSVNCLLLAVLVILVVTTAEADVFLMPTGQTSLEMVRVGDPGNGSDTRYGTPGYGAVADTYAIGKYEVTTGQYVAFLNAVAATDTYQLYDTSMWTEEYGCKIQRSGAPGSYVYAVSTDRANRPVNYVSFWDACRFCNWLQNGQPTGLQSDATTEDGAYSLSGYTGSDGRTITKKSDARWFIPSEDQWYKAAYYKGNGTNAGYWTYATQSDTAPNAEKPAGTDAVSGSANYNWAISFPYLTTEVGAYTAKPSVSAYDTFDQCGNIAEWTDALFSPTTARILRDGCWLADTSRVYAGFRTAYEPSTNYYTIGSRVAGAPEPSTLALLGAAAFGLLAYTWRRRRCGA